MSLSIYKRLFALSIAGVVIPMGCSSLADGFQETAPEPSHEVKGKEISFSIRDNNLDYTKAMVERTSITAFNCMVVKPDGTTLTDNAITARNGNQETLPGMYWPSSGTLSFFGVLPAVRMTNTGGTVSFPVGSPSDRLSGTEDYVFASRRNVPNASSPVSLAFDHILSNINSFSVSGTTPGTITTIHSITVSHPRYGTYLCSADEDSWSNLGADEVTELSTDFRSASFPSGADRISGTETGTASNGISVIPGTYAIRIRYTVTTGAISRSYDKSGSVSLKQGKKNNLSVSLTNDLSTLSISASVVNWVQGNSPSAWIEDFKPPKGYSVDLHNGEWAMSANGLSENADGYDGFYKNVQTSAGRCYRTMSITFYGYDSFHFKLFSVYTGNLNKAVYVSALDDDMQSRLPDISTASAMGVNTALGGQAYIGNTNYRYEHAQTNIDAYKTYSYTDLDPSRSYTVQIVAVDLISSINGLDATVIIPKDQAPPAHSITPDYNVMDNIDRWGAQPAGKSFSHAYTSPDAYMSEFGIYMQNFWLTVTGYSTLRLYAYGNRESQGTVYLYDQSRTQRQQSRSIQNYKAPQLYQYSDFKNQIDAYDVIEFSGLSPYETYCVNVSCFTNDASSRSGWSILTE